MKMAPQGLSLQSGQAGPPWRGSRGDSVRVPCRGGPSSQPAGRLGLGAIKASPHLPALLDGIPGPRGRLGSQESPPPTLELSPGELEPWKARPERRRARGGEKASRGSPASQRAQRGRCPGLWGARVPPQSRDLGSRQASLPRKHTDGFLQPRVPLPRQRRPSLPATLGGPGS